MYEVDCMKLVVICGVVCFVFLAGCGTQTSATFGTCLADMGYKFYGAYWCGHCNAQKQELQSAAQTLYVECSLPNRGGQTEECKEAGITAYPTWEYPDGTRETGTRSIEFLEQHSGCQAN